MHGVSREASVKMSNQYQAQTTCVPTVNVFTQHICRIYGSQRGQLSCGQLGCSLVLSFAQIHDRASYRTSYAEARAKAIRCCQHSVTITLRSTGGLSKNALSTQRNLAWRRTFIMAHTCSYVATLVMLFVVRKFNLRRSMGARHLSIRALKACMLMPLASSMIACMACRVEPPSV